MAVETAKQIRSLNFRAQLPKYFRIGAIAVLALTLIVVGIGYYRAKSNAEFRMVGFPTELSEDVIATVHGYERRETDGEVLKYYIKADTATTFSDNHQELENVYLQVFADDGSADEITASKAVYIPEENKNFTGYFAGNVVIASRDKLTLRTEQVTYSKSSDVATAEEDVDFERMNIKGRSAGATLNLGKKLLQLTRNVQFDIAAENGGYSKLTAGNAVYDQSAERVELLEGALLSKREPKAGSAYVDSNLRANRLIAYLAEPGTGTRVIDRAELFDTVEIDRNDSGGVVTIRAEKGDYSRSADRFELHQNVTAKITKGDTGYDGTASNAIYEVGPSKISLNGGGNLRTGGSEVSGDSLVAFLNSAYSIEKAEAAGNAKLHQASAEFVTDLSAQSLTGFFDGNRVLNKANAQGASEISRTSTKDNSRFTVSAATAVNTVFRGPDAVDTIETEGRTTIRLDVPDNGADSANRSVTADYVKTFFQSDGKNLQRAEAVGNAEFVATPHRASAENFGVRSNAPRFDCEFFSGRNDPKTCVASNGTKTFRTPTVQRDGRGEQTVTSNRLTLSFNERTRAIDRFDAVGKAKFTELDRSAVAESFSFASASEVVQLRGGEPTAWDSTARIKSKEIDWDTRNGRSAFRGGVSSTYYSTRSVGGASPFGDESKPFYVTAESAELDHQNEVGLFTGNARGWQGSNYVRGEQLELRKRESQLNVFGGVQSMLYNVRKVKGNTDGPLPVSAAAAEMHYDGRARTINYSGGVDIRQGTDRMTGGAAFIQLSDHNEMSQTKVDSNVAIVQAGRKAFGEGFIYTASDDRLYLRGRPARIEDNERGSTQGEELVIYLSDNRMSGEGRSQANPTGRVRNVYKVK